MQARDIEEHQFTLVSLIFDLRTCCDVVIVFRCASKIIMSPLKQQLDQVHRKMDMLLARAEVQAEEAVSLATTPQQADPCSSQSPQATMC